MNKYEDPENLQELIKDIFKMKTVKEINDLLMTTYPKFVMNMLEDYSKDYPHFDLNWRGLCLTLEVKKAFILLTDDYVDDGKHILLKTFCEVLTQAGFIIRKNTEYIACPVCNLAIPNLDIYDKLKKINIKVPEKWGTKCINC